MKQYQLTQDSGGFSKGTIFEGPKPIPDSEFADANSTNHAHTNLGEGYFEVGKDSQLCFYKDYVESSPLFVEIKKSLDGNQGIV